MDFEINVKKTIDKHKMLDRGDTVVAGVSGGADSVALLISLCALKDKYGLNIAIAHINHMLRGDEAERDRDYVISLAKRLSLPFYLKECDVSALAREKGISEEMAGREVRYGFFNEIIRKHGGGKIAVAHHRGDSAETTLINLIRGAGLNGLKGISPVNGNIIRPLIDCDRKSIEEYLEAKGIPFVTDSTNKESIYTRNIIRNRIIPEMEKINPDAVSTIYEGTVSLAEDDDFIAKAVAEYESLCLKKSDGEIEIDFAHIPHVHIAIKKRLILRACEIIKGDRKNISAPHLTSVLNLPTGGTASFGGIYVTRSYDRFIFTDTLHEFAPFSYNAKGDGLINIKETGKIFSFETISADKIAFYEKGVIYLDAGLLGGLILRSRRDGDTFRPLGLSGKKKVKDFLIDLKIPRRERSSIAVLESGGEIAAVLSLRCDERFKVTDKTKNILTIREVTQ